MGLSFPISAMLVHDMSHCCCRRRLKTMEITTAQIITTAIAAIVAVTVTKTLEDWAEASTFSNVNNNNKNNKG